MKAVDVARISRDSHARLAFLCEFVGFGDADWEALRDSAAVLGPKLPALLDALYDHLLGFDDVRRIFLGRRGEIDPQYMALRKEHLTEWVLTTVGAEGRAEFASYLVRIAGYHTSVAGEPDRRVPPRYMVALMTFVQSAVLSALFDSVADRPADLRRFAIAWTKILGIQLEMFLKVIAPHWPSWDEG